MWVISTHLHGGQEVSRSHTPFATLSLRETSGQLCHYMRLVTARAQSGACAQVCPGVSCSYATVQDNGNKDIFQKYDALR